MLKDNNFFSGVNSAKETVTEVFVKAFDLMVSRGSTTPDLYNPWIMASLHNTSFRLISLFISVNESDQTVWYKISHESMNREDLLC